MGQPVHLVAAHTALAQVEQGELLQRLECQGRLQRRAGGRPKTVRRGRINFPTPSPPGRSHARTSDRDRSSLNACSNSSSCSAVTSLNNASALRPRSALLSRSACSRGHALHRIPQSIHPSTS